MIVGYRYWFEWYTPYENPPDGKPRVIAEMFESVEHRKEREARGEQSIPIEFIQQKQPGYFLHIQAIEKPPVPLPAEKLASIRKKRLYRRLKNKYPLFADQFYQDEIKKRELYYEGQDTVTIKQKRENARIQYEQLYTRFLEYIAKHEGKKHD